MGLNTDGARRLASTIEDIEAIDLIWATAAQHRLDNLTKPQGSLGKLERLAIQLACIKRTDRPRLGPAAVMVCAADHGIVAQGVTSYPSEVTALMVSNFLREGAAVNQIARVCDAQVFVYDIGVGNPTADMSKGPALTQEECLSAILRGIDEVNALSESGFDVICLGEMGIGNSAAAAALTSALTHTPLPEVVGRGAGLDDATLAHKTAILEQALELNCVERLDPLEVLAAVGGREIAMMVGIILGAAARKHVIVSDGFIAGSAVLVAVAMVDTVKEYLVFSHRSAEPGHSALLRYLAVEPLLELDMRLGEGTGAVLALPLIRSAGAVLADMETFEEAGINV